MTGKRCQRPQMKETVFFRATRHLFSYTMSVNKFQCKVFKNDVVEHMKQCLYPLPDDANSLDDLFTILNRPPAYTVLRVNTHYHDRQEVRQQLQGILHKQYEIKKYPAPTVEEHPILADTLIIPSSSRHGSDVSPLTNEVVVDLLCAAAVLRGADIFAPGVMGAPQAMQVGDTVSVYGDVNGQCRRGLTQKFTKEKIFLGNGTALMSRTQLFVETEKPSGVAIRMTDPVFDCPSLNSVLTDKIFLQNLPSIVTGHVVGPQPGETVLDMCAAPGGKTTHLATLMGNTGVLIALDKSSGKVKRIRENADRLKLDMIRAYAYDSTKACQQDAQCNTGGKTTHLATLMGNTGVLIALDKSSGKVKRIRENADRLKLDMIRAYAYDSTKACQQDAQCNTDEWLPPYPPSTFDRILLDAPCSGLGQRPQIKNNLSMKDLRSYPPYQRKLFAVAVELLKPGGTLVYSTCTITIEENEGLIGWALKSFPQLQLSSQAPHLRGSGRAGSTSLLDSQLKLLQRFDPAVVVTSPESDCNQDTIGFFIAKFVKVQNR